MIDLYMCCNWSEREQNSIKPKRFDTFYLGQCTFHKRDAMRVAVCIVNQQAACAGGEDEECTALPGRLKRWRRRHFRKWLHVGVLLLKQACGISILHPHQVPPQVAALDLQSADTTAPLALSCVCCLLTLQVRLYIPLSPIQPTAAASHKNVVMLHDVQISIFF